MLRTGVIALLAASISAPALASETRGFVVSWFYMATHSQENDCAGGLNIPAEKLFARILREQGKAPQEVEKIMEGFPFTTNTPDILQRGRINGKPVNVYVNPTSIPDPKLHLVIGKHAFGFDLDGNAATGGFEDPETGAKGVDAQMYRAFGCYEAVRAMPPARPAFTTIQWDTIRDQMPAWLVEITGIDDAQNDDDVQVSVYRAREPVVRDALGEPQADLTFRVDPDLKAQTVAKGKIKNGVLTTAPFDFFMSGDPFVLPEYELKKAQLRLALKPERAAGYLGGLQPWEPIYFSFAIGGYQHEHALGFDIPGMYHALRNLADANPDPKSGRNLSISTSYRIEAVSAYIDHGNAKTAAR